MGEGRRETRAQAAARECQPGTPRGARRARVVAHHCDRPRADFYARHLNRDLAAPNLRTSRRASPYPGTSRRSS